MAIHLSVSRGRRIVSVAAIIAVGANTDGRREGNLEDVGHVVLIRTTARPRAYRSDEVKHLTGLLYAQCRSRLIRDHQPSGEHRSAGHGNALPLATRQRFDRVGDRRQAKFQVGCCAFGLLRIRSLWRRRKTLPRMLRQRNSRPRKRLETMSSTRATARSWYTVSMPAQRASSGP